MTTENLMTDRVRRAMVALHYGLEVLERTTEYIGDAEDDELAHMKRHGILDRVRDSMGIAELLLKMFPIDRESLPSFFDIAGLDLEKRRPLVDYDRETDCFLPGTFTESPGLQTAGQFFAWAAALLTAEVDATFDAGQSTWGEAIEGLSTILSYASDIIDAGKHPATQILRAHLLDGCGVDLDPTAEANAPHHETIVR